MKLFLSILFLGILLSSNVSANGAAAVVILENNNKNIMQQSQSGCIPPTDFAQEHNCQLRYPGSSDTRVGTYICSQNFNYYNLLTDCNGNVISFQSYNFVDGLEGAVIVGLILLFAIIIFGIILIILIYYRNLYERRQKKNVKSK